MQTKLLAYHGSAQLKADFVREVQWHRDQDAIVQGTYGEGTGADWKGCAVGCSIRSLNKINGKGYELDDHAAYEQELGIPEVLACFEDSIFEGLDARSARDWPLNFATVIRPGAELSLVMPKFMLWLLADKADDIIEYAGTPGRKAVQEITEFYQGIIAGDIDLNVAGKTVLAKEWDAAIAATGWGEVAVTEWKRKTLEQAATLAEAEWAATVEEHAGEAAWIARAPDWAALKAARAVAAADAAQAARAAGTADAAEAEQIAEKAAQAALEAAFQRMAGKLLDLLAEAT